MTSVSGCLGLERIFSSEPVCWPAVRLLDFLKHSAIGGNMWRQAGWQWLEDKQMVIRMICGLNHQTVAWLLLSAYAWEICQILSTVQLEI